VIFTKSVSGPRRELSLCIEGMVSVDGRRVIMINQLLLRFKSRAYD